MPSNARGGGSSSEGVTEKNMYIFVDIAHELDDPPQQNETAFAYLNRSGRAEAERVRQLVARWFHHYPAEKHGPPSNPSYPAIPGAQHRAETPPD